MKHNTQHTTHNTQHTTHNTQHKLIGIYLATLISIFCLNISCKKIPDTTTTPTKAIETPIDANFFINDPKSPESRNGNTSSLRGVPLSNGEYNDEIPTILGDQITNPYTIANMTNVYNTWLGSQLTSVPTTDLYVKFMPTDEKQVAFLEDSLDLDLYDHPLDYEVVQEGDYYIDPTKSMEDLPYLYTVVDPEFVFPADIPYTILANIHIPAENLGILEEFAESISAGATYVRKNIGGTNYIQRTDVPNGAKIPLPTIWCPYTYVNGNGEYVTIQIPTIDGCEGGGGPSGGGTVGAGTCGLPGLTCIDNKRPRGRLRVWDTQQNDGNCLPLVNVKVTAKRWFKGIKRQHHMYTNSQGEFQHNLRFNGKVSVRVFFRNATVSYRPFRVNIGIRLSLFTVKHKLGVFSNCDMNTISHVYEKPASRDSKHFLYFIAAHGINARNYQTNQAIADGVKYFSGHRLCVYLVKEGRTYAQGPNANVVLQNYIWQTNGLGEWMLETQKLVYYTYKATTSGYNIPPLVAHALKLVLGSQQPDILYSYNTSPENLSSNEINQQFYASFAKCALLKATKDNLGDRWKYYFKVKSKRVDIGSGLAGLIYAYAYNAAVEGDPISVGPSWAATIQSALFAINYGLSQPEKDFYNQAEGFGEYYGHYITNRQYTVNADAIKDQKRQELLSVGGVSSHKRFIEEWNPNETDDLDLDLKIGLFNDLEDDSPLEVIVFSPTSYTDVTKSIKAKDYEKSFIGASPAQFNAPELWSEVRENIKMRFPVQTTPIQNLFYAYNVN